MVMVKATWQRSRWWCLWGGESGDDAPGNDGSGNDSNNGGDGGSYYNNYDGQLSILLEMRK